MIDDESNLQALCKSCHSAKINIIQLSENSSDQLYENNHIPIVNVPKNMYQ